MQTAPQRAHLRPAQPRAQHNKATRLPLAQVPGRAQAVCDQPAPARQRAPRLLLLQAPPPAHRKDRAAHLWFRKPANRFLPRLAHRAPLLARSSHRRRACARLRALRPHAVRVLLVVLALAQELGHAQAVTPAVPALDSPPVPVPEG
jgi:hypothetical protein